MSEWQPGEEQEGGGMEEPETTERGAAESDWDENEPSPHQGEEGQQESDL